MMLEFGVPFDRPLTQDLILFSITWDSGTFGTVDFPTSEVIFNRNMIDQDLWWKK